MKKPEIQRERLIAGMSNLQLLTRELAASGPFAQMGFDDLEPDAHRAYFTFDVHHSTPVIAGPLVSGNYTTYHPAVLARSAGSLLHQQVNLRHQIKAYDPEKIRRDRIVGAIVGVHYPPHAAMTMPKTKEEAVPITAVATIFKQAEGVGKMLGDHLTSKQEQSISGEVAFQIPEIAVYLPSDGTFTPFPDLTAEMLKGIKRTNGGIFAGKMGGRPNGEQMIVAPGGTEHDVGFQGMGLTPNPAEREAQITRVQAERRADGTMTLCAEARDLALFARGVTWMAMDRTFALVKKVHSDGPVRLGHDVRTASREDPILHCVTYNGVQVLRRMSSVKIL